MRALVVIIVGVWVGVWAWQRVDEMLAKQHDQQVEVERLLREAQGGQNDK